MCGNLNARYPSCVKLYGRDLPFVTTATHLGHEIHQLANMEHDANVKRIRFIDKSTSIREAFNFADPNNVLQAIQVYAGDAYGAMLWDLYGVKAKQYFNTWNTCVKLCWDIPRGTHTYFLDNMLAKDFRSFSTNIKTRYLKFFRNLRKSKSEEVRVLSELVGRDKGSTTGKNLAMLEQEIWLNLWSTSPS